MPDRRTVLRAAALGIAAGATGLAACGSDDDIDDVDAGADGGGDAGAEPGGSAETGENGGADPGAPGDVLTPAADVPVGGGVILTGVVVTQPEEGEFRGFSSTCTHQGCTVSSVEAGTINCACHGSAFSAEDGSVQNGPATTPLPEVPVAVEGAEVVRA